MKEIRVEAEAILRDDGIWDLIVKCPYCGDKHYHGGGRGIEPLYGGRESHCFPSSRGSYEIVARKEIEKAA